MSETKSPPANIAPPVARVDAAAVPTTYSNYFRASGSAEELILDFGFDAQRHSDGDAEPIVLMQRLVLTWGHAQQLARMIQNLLRIHEQKHGSNINQLPTPPT